MVSTTAAAAAAMFLNWGLGFILWWVWIWANRYIEALLCYAGLGHLL